MSLTLGSNRAVKTFRLEYIAYTSEQGPLRHPQIVGRTARIHLELQADANLSEIKQAIDDLDCQIAEQS